MHKVQSHNTSGAGSFHHNHLIGVGIWADTDLIKWIMYCSYVIIHTEYRFLVSGIYKILCFCCQLHWLSDCSSQSMSSNSSLDFCCLSTRVVAAWTMSWILWHRCHQLPPPGLNVVLINPDVTSSFKHFGVIITLQPLHCSLCQAELLHRQTDGQRTERQTDIRTEQCQNSRAERPRGWWKQLKDPSRWQQLHSLL